MIRAEEVRAITDLALANDEEFRDLLRRIDEEIVSFARSGRSNLIVPLATRPHYAAAVGKEYQKLGYRVSVTLGRNANVLISW